MRLFTLFSTTSYKRVSIFTALIFFCTVTACGKKGLLYLPAEPQPVAQKTTKSSENEKLKKDATEAAGKQGQNEIRQKSSEQ